MSVVMLICGLILFLFGANSLFKIDKNINKYTSKENKEFVEISRHMNEQELKTAIGVAKILHILFFGILTILGGSLIIYSFYV